MKVGLGEHPRFVLRVLEERLRGYDVIIYPSFFDDKSLLMGGEYRKYFRKLLRLRKRVKIAVYPDYFYRIPSFVKCLDVIWIYPLHSLSELGFVLRLSDVVELYLGFPNRSELRDYSLTRFLEVARTYGFKTWLLGLKPCFRKYVCVFDATDVSPISFNMFLSDLKKEKNLEKYIREIVELSKVKKNEYLITPSFNGTRAGLGPVPPVKRA
ncbi:MAG: hypothetical protein DRN04_07565 [Thermoprotei archaeon]|mgnify:CR=1 FL=1|nr:MAG: hypothetical protein DRN04_07565 [Thermoprotei archaeon]